MRLLNNLRLRTKVRILLGTLIAGLALTGLASAHFAYRLLLNDRVAGLKSIADIALDMADTLEQQVKAGRMTRDQALDTFRERLATIRYDNGTGYVFVYTMDGTTIYTPDIKKIRPTSKRSAPTASMC